MEKILSLLRQHGITPTPQRQATMAAILSVSGHLSADEVWEQVKKTCPTVSRATVYNTLNLLAEKKLLKAQVLKEGRVVFDHCLEPHHHFIDDETGAIHDVPWDTLQVTGKEALADFDIREYQVVLRGRRKKSVKGRLRP